MDRYAVYIVMIWLVGIAFNLATQGMFFDIAVRDIEIALGAFALAKLTEVREAALAESPARQQARRTENAVA